MLTIGQLYWLYFNGYISKDELDRALENLGYNSPSKSSVHDSISELKEVITPSPEAIENFKKVFRDPVEESKYSWLLNRERTVAIVTVPRSIEEQKSKMSLGELSYKVKAYFNGRVKGNGSRTSKYVKIGENWFNWRYLKAVIAVLGKEVNLLQFGKDTPLFVYNDKGICLIAHTLNENVNEEQALSLDYICKIEGNVKEEAPQDAQVWDVTRLSEEEKDQLIKRLAMELGVRL
jgi:hypothetical protein